MADLTSTSTFVDGVPGQNFKLLMVKTPSTANASDTIDVSSKMKTIRGLLIIDNVGNVATASATWSSTTITIPSTATTTEQYNILVWGED